MNYRIPFIFVFFLRGISAENLNPLELQRILENATLICETNAKDVKTIKLDPDESVVIQGPEFIACIMFKENLNDAITTYRFWTFSKKLGLQVTGSGELLENYWRVSKVNDKGETVSLTAIDRGSITKVNAGIFKIEWSKGDFLYYTDAVLVKKGDFEDYRIAVRDYINAQKAQ